MDGSSYFDGLPLVRPLVRQPYIHLLPKCIREKVACYLYSNTDADKKIYCRKLAIIPSGQLITTTPIKTLILVDWLSPGYIRNNQDAHKRRRLNREDIAANDLDAV